MGRWHSPVTRYLDVATRTWRSVRAAHDEEHRVGYNMSGAYHPDLDLFLVLHHPLGVTGPDRARLWAMRCTEPERGWVQLAQTGGRPSGPAPGGCSRR